jgi:hypothetical protein
MLRLKYPRYGRIWSLSQSGICEAPHASIRGGIDSGRTRVRVWVRRERYEFLRRPGGLIDVADGVAPTQDVPPRIADVRYLEQQESR